MSGAVPLRLKKGVEENLRQGFPWVYAGDIIESSELLHAPPGSLVSIQNARGKYIATGYYNPKSQIACRVLTLAEEEINTAFFAERIKRAVALRDKMVGIPYYRLVHSETDLLPGLLIDRFGDIIVAQAGTAGMDALSPLWLEAITQVLKPKAILLRNDNAARALEGLPQEIKTVHGEIPELVQLREYETVFLADLINGQKTGWFYDQRDNRKMIADIAKGKTVLDVYSHSGGFGIPAARAGAEVTLVDSSKLALEIAAKAAALNNVSCEAIQGDAFEIMQKLAAEKKQYDIVLADPPAFVKTKKDIAAGLKGYEKVARLAAALVKEGGYLFVASCSHNATRGAFNNAVISGAKKAGRNAEIIKQTSAAPDHPRHTRLNQSEYLKGILLSVK